MAKKKAIKTPSPAPTPTSTPKPTPTPTPTPAPKATPTPTPPATPSSERKTPEPTKPTPAPTPTATPEATPAFLSSGGSEDQALLNKLAAQAKEVEARIAAAALQNLTHLIAWIKNNAQHFGDDHKRQIRLALGEDETRRAVSPASQGKRGRPKGSKNATNKATKQKSGATSIPKYRLPDGTLWNGKGRAASSEFIAWAETAEGKAWKKTNTTGFDWPLNRVWAQANAGKVKAEAKKAGASVAKKVVPKKAAKKATKKTVKKSAK